MLNISDNGITNEGLKILEPYLSNESNLIVLNLSNNELVGENAIQLLSGYIRSSKQLQELNLSYNKIGD